MRGIRRIVLTVTIAFGTTGILPFVPETAVACPSCKAANETDSLLPRAYMYSILFMLAMPMTVFAGFGFCFYRMSRNEAVMADLVLADLATGDLATGGQSRDGDSLNASGTRDGVEVVD